MYEGDQEPTRKPHLSSKFRGWFARHLGVSTERKQEVYISLSQSVSPRDASYWLQILFAAGIATLGLVLNSPSVIIGAMLISPLMGTILSFGLALAAGDLILGVRSVVTLALSCIVAVGFAILLVGLLPFKEMTAEIATRTQPNTLDLLIALFSGAIGSIATCKEIKGVVTSIPGVSIAVALMPPLCVVGYGLGIALSVDSSEGLRVAGGGGLNFLTNLVSITFSAMIVFILLHIDSKPVKKRVEEWRNTDSESARVGRWSRFIPEKVRTVGTLPGRLLMILIPILIILVPLSQSFSRLKNEIRQHKEENRVRSVATDVWNKQFGKQSDGKERSYLDSVNIADRDGKLKLNLHVITGKPYSPAEKNEFSRLVAARLSRETDSIEFQLVEIPTTSSELSNKPKDETRVVAPPTIAQLKASFANGIEAVMRNLRLPPPAQLITYKTETTQDHPLHLNVIYLGDRDIGMDAQSLLMSDIRDRLGDPAATVSFTRVPPVAFQIIFKRDQTTLIQADNTAIDSAAQILMQYPSLKATVVVTREKNEAENTARLRAQTIAEYITGNLRISEGRIAVITGEESGHSATMSFELASSTRQQ